MGVCLIVDFAMNKGVTWASYTLITVPFGWIITVPLLLAKKHRILLSLIAVTVTTIPFLFMLDKITPVRDWAYGISLPVAILSFIISWPVYFMFRYVKISYWYKSAIAVFLYGVIASPVINVIVDRFMEEDISIINLNNIINVFACVVITVLLVFIGMNKQQKENV